MLMDRKLVDLGADLNVIVNKITLIRAENGMRVVHGITSHLSTQLYRLIKYNKIYLRPVKETSQYTQPIK